MAVIGARVNTDSESQGVFAWRRTGYTAKGVKRPLSCCARNSL